jgi:hypothetical protein
MMLGNVIALCIACAGVETLLDLRKDVEVCGERDFIYATVLASSRISCRQRTNR